MQSHNRVEVPDAAADRPPPDFVIAGAPKSGTSALYEWLREHPDVFLPALKEPHFFSQDLPGLKRVATRNAYDSLYRGAPDGALRGDASTSYLRSELAVPRLLDDNPRARIVVILRDPAEAAHAFHSELLYQLAEEEADFEKAWKLQKARKQGRCSIPAPCRRDPGQLQYKDVFSYGTQLERLFVHAPAGQRLVLLFDDLQTDPAAAYRRALSFLGLGDDRRADYSQVNPSKVLRSRRAAMWHRSAYRRARALPFYTPAKRLANVFGIHPNHLLSRWNRKPAHRSGLDQRFRRELRREFAAEIARTELLLGRSLACWSAPDADPVASGDPG